MGYANILLLCLRCGDDDDGRAYGCGHDHVYAHENGCDHAHIIDI
jgi:hypothetical protein